MFCPVCLYEYKEDVTKCPDCGSALVKELPEEEELPDIEIAELCDVKNEIESEALRAMLADRNIYSFLRTNLLPHSNITLGFFKTRSYGTVMINKEDLKAALEVLKDFKEAQRP
jgi:hypothetical protein